MKTSIAATYLLSRVVFDLTESFGSIAEQRHRLRTAIRQRAPEPLGGAETESAEPPRAGCHLNRKERHSDDQHSRVVNASVPAEAVAIEQSCADERLREIR